MQEKLLSKNVIGFYLGLVELIVVVVVMSLVSAVFLHPVTIISWSREKMSQFSIIIQ